MNDITASTNIVKFDVEDAIPTIWLPEQLAEITAQVKEIEDAMA